MPCYKLVALCVSRYQADYVISPVVSQELPFFTLVSGGDKAIQLASLLQAKCIIPMANGELQQSGILASLVRSEGSMDQIVSKAAAKGVKVVSVVPGQAIPLPQ